MVKVFESAPKFKDTDYYPNTTPLEFVLPGDLHVYTATPPKQAIWQRTSLSSRSNVSDERRIAAMIDFLAGTLKQPADRQRFEDRMLDSTDELDLLDVLPVVSWLSMSWAAQMRGQQLAEETPQDVSSLEQPAEPPAEPPVEASVSAEIPAVAEVPQVALPPVPPPA